MHLNHLVKNCNHNISPCNGTTNDNLLTDLFPQFLVVNLYQRIHANDNNDDMDCNLGIHNHRVVTCEEPLAAGNKSKCNNLFILVYWLALSERNIQFPR